MKKLLILINVLLLPSLASAATLGVSPSSQSVNSGDTFTVTINLDTQGASVDGVDLRYLNYSPSLLEVQDANTSSAGVQIAPGNLMPMTLANTVDNNLGRITFSQVALGGSKYTGSGVLATITFKAKATGTANINFNHISGNTTDSNVAAGGSDVLTAVINGSYVIGSGSSSGSSGAASSGSNTTTVIGGSSGGGSSSSSGSSNTSGSFLSSQPSLYSYSYTFSTNLSRGSEGNDVLELQKFLASQGYLTTDSITGYFGPITESALQKFQAAQGIVSSGSPLTTGYGSFGPSTRTRVNALMGISGGLTSFPSGGTSISSLSLSLLTRNLYRGLSGDDVRVLQQFLVNQGLTTADNITGFYGPITEATVKKFQAAQGIVSSGSPLTTGYGNVGPSTRARINAMISVGGAVQAGSTGTSALQAQIQELQRQVNELLIKLQNAR